VPDAVLSLISRCILPLFFLTLALRYAFIAISTKRLQITATRETRGTITNITVRAAHSMKRRYYKATIRFLVNGQTEIVERLERRLEAVDFLEAHKTPPVDVSVYYNAKDPRRYYIKELTLPVWRYAAVSAVLCGCFLYSGWLLLFVLR